MSNDTSVYKQIATAFLLAVIGAVGLAGFYLTREKASPFLVGTWIAEPDHHSSEKRERYRVDLTLNKNGTFLLTESFQEVDSPKMSTIQYSGDWSVTADILRLTTEKGHWNQDLEYMEHQILKASASELVLQQGGEQFHFRGEMR